MTTTATPSPADPFGTSRRWLVGRHADSWLGCGLAYLALFLLLGVAGDLVLAAVPYGMAPLLTLVAGGPHYGATLLRVYERRDDRRAYATISLFATALALALFVGSLFSAALGSWTLTVYLTWSPWHYSGQNYGLCVMFLGRRSVPLSPIVKRALHASFWLSFGMIALSIHALLPGASYAPISYADTAYSLRPLGIPDPVASPLFAGLGGAWLGAVTFAFTSLARVAPLRELLPSALLVGSQALWFVVPALARRLGLGTSFVPLASEHATYAMVWIAVAHSVQYLWVSWAFARSSGRARSFAPYYGKCLLAGAAVWTMPALLFAPGFLGRLPYDAGLAVLVAACVNLHHFLLDGAIWKLRDGRVARLLLRSAPGDTVEPPAPPGARGGLRIWVWATGVACVVVMLAGTLLEQRGLHAALARGEVAGARATLDGLAWLGRDSAAGRAAIARLAATQHDFATAAAQAEAAIRLRPDDAATQHARAQIALAAGDASTALHALSDAIRLDPSAVAPRNDLAWIRATSDDPRLRDAREAVALAEGAAAATKLADATVLDTLAAAYASALRFPEAVAAAERGRVLAAQRGDAALQRAIDERLVRYRAGESVRAPIASALKLSPSVTVRDAGGREVRRLDASAPR